MLPLGAGLGPEGSPGAQLAYRRGSCSTHWKSFCEAWRPIQRSKVTLNRLAVMKATVPPEERAVSDRATPPARLLGISGDGARGHGGSPGAGPTLLQGVCDGKQLGLLLFAGELCL